MIRRRFLFMLGGVAGAGGLAALGLLPLPARGLRKAERTARALGSRVSLTALHEDLPTAERAIDDALAELDRVEEVMSLYRPHSQICTLNREGALEKPHPYLLDVLRASERMARMTDGAFDVTVQPLWELRSAGRTPGPADLRLVDWRQVELSDERIRLRKSGGRITLNGIAQGFAADRVRHALQARSIRHALVDTGELGSLGRKADGIPWTAGIQHPREADAYAAIAELDGRFMATSGDYATRFSADFRDNHIVDPRTGLSPVAFSSVTVLAPTGMEADALSTAIFVLGPEKGLDLVRATPGADALFVSKDGRMTVTHGFPRTA